MRVIVLAAGQSRRFQEEGYKTPKPFLNIDFRGHVYPMIVHVLRSIPLQFQDISVAIPAGWLETAEPIADIFPYPPKFIEIEKSEGPAHTAIQMIDHVGESDSVLLMDCDIINHPNDLWILCCLTTCGVLVSRSTNPAASYVTNTGSFFNIKEKERISEFAVRGAYFIPKDYVKKFVTLTNILRAHLKEPYVSHVFDRLMDNKFALETTYDPVDWGTPLDVKLSSARIIQ